VYLWVCTKKRRYNYTNIVYLRDKIAACYPAWNGIESLLMHLVSRHIILVSRYQEYDSKEHEDNNSQDQDESTRQ